MKTTIASCGWVKRIILILLLLVSTALFSACSGAPSTGEVILENLEVNFPGRRFEIVNEERRGTGIDGMGALFGQFDRIHTIKSIDSDIEFTVHNGHNFDPDFLGTRYVQAIWNDAHVRWNGEFRTNLGSIISDVHGHGTSYEILHPSHIFISNQNSGFGSNFIMNSATNNASAFLSLEDFEFVNEISSSFASLEELLASLKDFEKPMNVFIGITYSIGVSAHGFNQSDEVEQIRRLFEEFIMPLSERISNETEHELRLEISITYAVRFPHNRTAARFRWNSDSIPVTAANIDYYDFDNYFEIQ